MLRVSSQVRSGSSWPSFCLSLVAIIIDCGRVERRGAAAKKTTRVDKCAAKCLAGQSPNFALVLFYARIRELFSSEAPIWIRWRALDSGFPTVAAPFECRFWIVKGVSRCIGCDSQKYQTS
ncbi:hypothetical protein L596_014443 [Steinernema carpocapsae]|uniref:Uncharacterized protein n=1 Tax=Steinernema carpocapsae TaxID=34508 RepID=A0A4U5NC62_STECR|nr:hypothetical protein L596_014443 [Steinernema carpocapsae]